MDYGRKTKGSSAVDVADVYKKFIEECAKRNITLDNSDKRIVNTDLRSFSKKAGKKFFKMSFEELAQELSGRVEPLAMYLSSLSGDSFLEEIQGMEQEDTSDNLSESVNESQGMAEEVEEPKEPSEPLKNDYEYEQGVRDDAVSEPEAEPEVVSAEPVEEPGAVVNKADAPAATNPSPVPQAEEKGGVSQSKTLDALSRIKDMRGGKVVDSARKREIAKEINSLKVQRDSRTRTISMKAEDMAVLTSILEYAETKEGKEKRFMECDMDRWNGIFHAAVDCMIEKLAEEGRHGYLNAIANGQVKLHKKQAEIDEKINKLLAEKEGL